LCQVRAIEAPIEGYEVVDLTWEVEYEHGKTTLLNGTAQQVHSQLLQLNPDFEAQFGTVEEIAAINMARYADEDQSMPEKRDSNVCGGGGRWTATHCRLATNNANYLYGVPGRPTNGPGPGACGRVSCSYQSAIWWCNDVSRLKALLCHSSNSFLEPCH
jgi:hypothetical protein